MAEMLLPLVELVEHRLGLQVLVVRLYLILGMGLEH
jgi:hypothetical protein